MEQTDTITPSEYKTFVLASLALALAVWPIGFNLGAFNAVFFDEIFRVWVAASVILLISFVVPDRYLEVGWQGRLAMALPTLWVAGVVFSGNTIQQAANEPFAGWVGLAVLLIALPYSIYLWAILVTPDFESVSHRFLQVVLIGLLVIIGFVGFAVGRNNDLFLTCDDFRVSGNDLPANCSAGASE